MAMHVRIRGKPPKKTEREKSPDQHCVSGVAGVLIALSCREALTGQQIVHRQAPTRSQSMIPGCPEAAAIRT